MTPPSSFRATTALDAEAMALVHAAVFAPPERWDASAFRTLLAGPLVHGLLSEPGGIALFRTVVDEAELLTIAVAPEARRRGLGTALLGAGMEEARRRAAVRMFLEVARSNAAALALYARMGFHEIGRRSNYYGAGRDAVLMRAMLHASGSASS